MIKTFKIAVTVCIWVVVTAALSLAGPAAETDKMPSASEIKTSLDEVPTAVFPQLKFEFDPVFEGTEIKHDFVVENKGEAPLVIKSIRPD